MAIFGDKGARFVSGKLGSCYLSPTPQLEDSAFRPQALLLIAALAMTLRLVVLFTVFVGSALGAESSVQELRSRYLEFLFRFGKSESRAWSLARLERFRSSLLYIESQNQKFRSSETHFTVVLNDMSDWFEDELASRFNTNNGPQFRRGSRSANDTTGVDVPAPTLNLRSSLSWASADNPLGRSIVPPIRNQGTCGACWSFVAVAAVEASVHLNTNYSVPLPLSAQELLDCDVAFNRGCQGGNPLYAFEYTMVAGLTGWADYGYQEKVGPCQRKKLPGRASIEGFIRVPPSDQAALERALSVSPVAVGVCGTDQGFIFYEGGIFDARDCCTTQNHALLLVGFGYDSNLKLDYWQAQNSWGTSWGENGYVRLLRTHGNSTGQCGLATSPTAAKGGYLMHPQREGIFGGELLDPQDGKRAQAALSLWLEAHWREMMLGASVVLFAISLWLLWYDSIPRGPSTSKPPHAATTTYQSMDLSSDFTT